MDNQTLFDIEKLGAKIYFFGECVWSTILKIPTYHYKLAIVGGDREAILPLFQKYEVQTQKLMLLIKDNDSVYECYFPKVINDIPQDPIPINNAILSLDGKLFRAEDLRAKTIQTTSSVFLDYPEEMLRICRIAAQTGFKINVSTWLLIKEHSRLIRGIIKRQPAYVGQQLNDILLSDNPMVGFNYLWETGLLTHILPEFNRCYEISQTRRGDNMNVFIHTLLAINASERSQLIRWTMLFHDMAKPLTMEVTADGKMHFFKHEVVGAKLAGSYMKRYRLPEELITRVKTLIENHMFDADPKLTPKGVRRLIRRVGKENIYELLKVREADRSGSIFVPSMDKINLLRQKIDKEISNV